MRNALLIAMAVSVLTGCLVVEDAVPDRILPQHLNRARPQRLALKDSL